jgi:hypothetical protein
MKAIFRDGDGFVIWYKRLERGTWQLPAADSETLELEAHELAMILRGLESKEVWMHLREEWHRDAIHSLLRLPQGQRRLHRRLIYRTRDHQNLMLQDRMLHHAQVTSLCSTLTVVGSAIGRTPTPTPRPTSSRSRCHSAHSPSATAAAGQDGLVGRLRIIHHDLVWNPAQIEQRASAASTVWDL